MKQMEPLKLTIDYELRFLTVEEFDKWRDNMDESKEDACDTCPVKKICDWSMEYDRLLEEQEERLVPQLGCSGIYDLALSITKKEYGYG